MWGRWIIHPVLTVTPCLHNTELLFECISSNTQFTHFDNAHISLCACDALCPDASAFSWRRTRPSRCFKACIDLADFPQHLLPSCPCLLPVCSVSQTLSVLPPPAVWRTVITDAACHPRRSDRQPWDENTGCEIAAWDIYISLPGCLPASDTSESGRVAACDIKNISHRAGGVALEQLTILILKTNQMRRADKTFFFCCVAWN